MLSITYPTDPADLNKFHEQYYNCLIDSNAVDQIEIDRILNKIPFKGKCLDLRSLLTSPFDELVTLNMEIKKSLGLVDYQKLRLKFRYKKNQGKLAWFFMNQSSIKLDSCFYCNMDYIFAFRDFSDFKNPIDFVNSADFYEFQNIKGIKKKTSRKILEKRKLLGKFSAVDEIPATATSKKIIKEFNFNKTHNHFTLDHVLPQSKYRILSLCLYNLIPSCYACNSKFKKDRTFSNKMEVEKVSPSSKNFSLNKDFEFKVLYAGELKDIKSTEDFKLIQDINSNHKLVKEYFKMFKIPSRYVYQKTEALNLLKKKEKYPETNLLLISRLLKYPIDELRSDVYGEELFNKEHNTKPLTKFKRDIARNIDLKKVLES